jgi:hypothetical protein
VLRALTLRRLLLLSCQPSAPAFSSGDFISSAEHENDRAEVVIVCEPGALLAD